MTELKHKKSNGNKTSYLVLMILAISISVFSLVRTYSVSTDSSHESSKETTFERIKRTKTIRVGYGGFPPYTIVNPNIQDKNERVSGFAIDMVKDIVEKSDGLITNIEWVNLNWETFNADMDSKKFDFLADAVYNTIPKAMTYNFTIPYSYFGISCAVVKKGDNRFQDFVDLNREDIKITYAIGYVSGPYAMSVLEKPEFVPVEVGDNPFAQMDYVINGRADVAIQDVPSVVQYAREHSSRVKALWVDNPPSSVPGSFVCRKEDKDLLEFLNTAIRILDADGTLTQLDKKWNSLGYFKNANLIPGAGLKLEN